MSLSLVARLADVHSKRAKACRNFVIPTPASAEDLPPTCNLWHKVGKAGYQDDDI